MLPSETMIWQPEFTDKTLSRKPGAVHFVTRHKVKAFICLDDDATLFPPEYPHLFRTDYYTGVNEKDLTDLIARYNVLMTRFY